MFFRYPFLRSRWWTLLALLFVGSLASGQSTSPIITSFAKIDSLQRTAPRPMVIFIHTDWCRYCEHMQQTSLRDAKVVNLLNDQFYFLTLNAETEQPLTFGGHVFAFQPLGRENGVHALAAALGTVDGQLQYPALVVMNAAYEINFQYSGFLDNRALIKILRMAKPN